MPTQLHSVTEMAPLLCSPDVAAQLLSVHRTTVQELMNRGEIESIKIGKARRIIVESLTAYIERERSRA